MGSIANVYVMLVAVRMLIIVGDIAARMLTPGISGVTGMTRLNRYDLFFTGLPVIEDDTLVAGNLGGRDRLLHRSLGNVLAGGGAAENLCLRLVRRARTGEKVDGAEPQIGNSFQFAIADELESVDVVARSTIGPAELTR